MKEEHQIEIAIYRAEPSQAFNVNQLDYGTLLASLTDDQLRVQLIIEPMK